jgi:hypothetical protein
LELINTIDTELLELYQTTASLNSKTGSYATTGSNTFVGNQTISGSLFISGATEFGGDLVPKTARGATLGTLEKPFREIYVQSGSINIASDNPGDPNTTLSNEGGNILVSAGGMRLVEPGNSFIAETGSFQFISGSMTQVGDYTQTGDYTMVGDKTITGSLNVSGSTNLTGSVIINRLTYPTSNFADAQYGVEVPTLDTNNIFTMEVPKTIYEYVKNDSGTTLYKGTPVHSTGTVGFNTLVIAASASVASTMPATYILAQDLDDEEEGLGIAIGAIQGVNTTGLIAGDAVYVGANGGWTQTKPTGSNLIQNLGIVTKVGVNGGGVVLGAGRSNDVPNIQQGYFWVGNKDSVATPIPTSSFAITSSANIFYGNQTITGSLMISGSGSLNGDNIVASNTIMKIETISSASYAALNPPVSGTLYIII